MKFGKNMSMVGKIFWAVVLAVFFLMVFDLGWRKYQVWKDQQAVEELKQALEQTETGRERRMEEDTAGGNTPQETLQMFIEAVEAGDYELASKYFVIEKQEEWRENLEEVNNADKLNTLLEPLTELDVSTGNYSDGGDKFFIHKPVLVSFTLYPSGNWKIEEI